MNISPKHFLCTLIFIATFQSVFSQEINYTAGFKGILDNREYFTKYSPHYTVFGSILKSGVNLKSGDHNLDAGIHYLYEFGDLENTSKPKFYANYNFVNKNHKFYFGVYDRENLINIHRVLLNDTLLYSRPYVEGIFYGINHNNIYEQIWLDWTSLQSDTIRETFLVGQSGKIDLNPFFIKHQFLMLHYSLPKIKSEGDAIRDNFGFIAQAGFNTNSFLFLDSASFSIGTMIGMDRHRGFYDWNTPIGALIETNLNYKYFKLDGLIYLGEEQNMFYGDKFYRAGNYSRWDLSLNLFNKKYLNSEIVYTIHIVDNVIDHAQAIRIWFNLDYLILKLE